MAKTISVVIPTLGRSKELLDTVSALLRQTRVPDEIVVIDQNMPTLSEVDRFFSQHSIIKHFKNESPGVSINYNRCFKRATGDIVLYLDDDIIPDERLVEFHLQNYSGADPKLGGVAGRVEQPQGDLPPEKIKTFGTYHPWSGRIVASFNADRRADVNIAPGGNMSFYRKVLEEVGGFDEGFAGNGYFFETDASYRVHRHGYRIVFDPRANVKHLMAPVGGARIKDKSMHTYFYVKNGVRLFRRHSPAIASLWISIRFLSYVLFKSLYNLSLRIFTKGMQGFFDGWRENLNIRASEI